MLSLLVSAVILAAPLPSDPLDFVKLAPPERKKLLAQLSKEDQAKLYASISTEQLLEVGKAAAAALGPYSARVVKRERVDGKLLEPQTIELVVRDSPLAIKAHYVAGPAKGRRVVYDSSVKKDELRAKEAGFLGIAGAVWIDINGSLARGDSNHPITEFGFGPVVRLLENAFAEARPYGGFSRSNDGFDKAGRYCHTYTAPKAPKKFYATKAKICFDTVLAVPVWLEIDDAEGRLESYYFSDVTQVSKPEFSL